MFIFSQPRVPGSASRDTEFRSSGGTPRGSGCCSFRRTSPPPVCYSDGFSRSLKYPVGFLLFYFIVYDISFISPSRPSSSLLSFILTFSLQRIISKGKLNPRLLQLFEDAEVESVSVRVKQLNISKYTPPLIRDKAEHGRKSPWF